MPGNLNHLKVLLTRQASTVDDLQAQIAALGGSSINLPLFAIESLLDQQLVAALQIKFKRGALALCISRNAAQIVLPHLSQPNAVTWAAIGPSTAQYLQQQGVAKVLFPQQIPYDSAALMQTLKLHNINLENKYIMVFTGESGDARLSSALQQERAIVDTFAVYRRIMPEIPGEQLRKVFSMSPAIDIILITCVTSLDNLIQMATEINLDVRNIPLLVVSPRIQKYAKSQGFTKIHTAPGMSDAHIIATLTNI